MSVRKVRGGGVREGGRDRVKVVAGWKFMTMRKWMQRERERERERERGASDVKMNSIGDTTIFMWHSRFCLIHQG